MINPLVKSWTRSLSSVKSSVVGGTKPRGCLVEAARLIVEVLNVGRDRPTSRKILVKARDTAGEAIFRRRFVIIEVHRLNGVVRSQDVVEKEVMFNNKLKSEVMPMASIGFFTKP